MSQFPKWKFVLLIGVLIWSLLYSLPNLFSQDPSVQISGNDDVQATATVMAQAKQALQSAKLTYRSAERESNNLLLFRFDDSDKQLRAKEVLKAALSNQYTVALNLASTTPSWLSRLGAEPMKLGLDLRGGVHFLLEVDVKSVVRKRVSGDIKNFSTALRKARVRYKTVGRRSKSNSVVFTFKNAELRNEAYALIRRQFPDYLTTKLSHGDQYRLMARLSPPALTKMQQNALEQTMTVLRNRVNELGVAEPIVQQQGRNRIAVDLPGIQDAAQAKQILGATATIEFHLVDEDNDVQSAVAGQVPFGSRVYRMAEDNRPILLKNQIILSGNNIVNASATYDENARPSVNIRASGSNVNYFARLTRENVGKRLAIVFVESKTDSRLVDGQVVRTQRRIEKVISAATITVGLGNEFRITGLQSMRESRNLALLLRAGALPANIYPVEESVVGPSLGKENIRKGVMSIEIGFIAIVIFMLVYYRLFGLVADLALAFNLVLLVGVLSLLGATLTLPGIAGIVLTVGMAIDANVLIFERIREELRNGLSPLAAIEVGYEKAFSTIVDANVTTLIVAVVLFAAGSGSVKGFAVTLTIGLLTSMFTAITGTRAVVHLIYGRKRKVERLSIGI